MIKTNQCISRRDFLKTAGIAGIGSTLATFKATAHSAGEPRIVPTRPFGNTGIDVPILSFGGSLNTSLSLLVLRQAVKWGVTYWDTANTYMGGRSEKGMGKYFEKYPADRRRIFLVTKSHAWSTQEMSADLDLSLERMHTDYIDLYFMHSVNSSSELTNEKKAWAEKKKAEGFTDPQAKLKAVWQHPNIASTCTEMPNMTLLMSNVAAAMDKTKLSAHDNGLLQRYARETHSNYCTGCTAICESAVADNIPIGDIMRYLMYSRSYGDLDWAVAEFKKLSAKTRQKMAAADYSVAEQKCPQNMLIGRLMREALAELG